MRQLLFGQFMRSAPDGFFNGKTQRLSINDQFRMIYISIVVSLLARANSKSTFFACFQKSIYDA
ncbi:hypothetical protein CW354_16775 [Marinicaulis flavus]|uniref:Uncharacterized protein n=1 Tax=Hyphococcus luteus TaxID=2058213 RepID=A0A2S7K0K8_9PROT|nr:hypothetical protein CW354_16775 [Marinicaulis flavus]